MQNNNKIVHPQPQKSTTQAEAWQKTVSAPINNKEFQLSEAHKNKLAQKKTMNLGSTVFQMDGNGEMNFGQPTDSFIPQQQQPQQQQQQKQETPVIPTGGQQGLKLSKPKKKLKLPGAAPEFKPDQTLTQVTESKTNVLDMLQPKQADIFNQLDISKNTEQAPNKTADSFTVSKDSNNSGWDQEIPKISKQQQQELDRKKQQEKAQKAEAEKLKKQKQEEEVQKQKQAEAEKLQKQKQQQEEEKQRELEKQKQQAEEAEKLRKQKEEEAKKLAVPEQITFEFVIKFLNTDKAKSTDILDQTKELSEYIERSLLRMEPEKAYSKPGQKPYNTHQQGGYNQNKKPHNQHQSQQQGSFKGTKGSQYGQQKQPQQQQQPETFFGRNTIDPALAKLQAEIKNSQGAWSKEIERLKEDDKYKLVTKMRYALQTISPDNMSLRVDELIEHQLSDEPRNILIGLIIEKGITQTKYVKTFAELCSYLIKHEKSVVIEKKNLFKVTLIGEIQGLFEKSNILERKKPWAEMTEEQIKSYLQKKKERLKQFVNFIGELYKVNVLPYKLIKICFNLLLNQYINKYLAPFSNKKPKNQTQDEIDEEKYQTNDHLEALLEFIDNVGKDIEENESKKQEIPLKPEAKELQENLLKRIQTDIKTKNPNFVQGTYHQCSPFILEYLLKLMEFLKNENIVDVRVGALIMNMIDRKKNGWKISESKLGTRAVTKGEVHEQHMQKLAESEKAAAEYERENPHERGGGNRGSKGGYYDKQKGRQSGYKDKNSYYQQREPKEQYQKKEQYQPKQAPKVDQLELLKDDSRKPSQQFEDLASKELSIKIATGSQNEERGEDVTNFISKIQNQLEIDIIPMLFKEGTHGSEEQTQKKTQFICEILKQYYSQNQNSKLIVPIIQKLLANAYCESSDFPYMTKTYATIIDFLRGELQLFKLGAIKIASSDDEDEDEEIFYFLESLFSQLGQITMKREPDLNKFGPELKDFFSNLKFKCDIDENQADLLIDKLKQ